MKRSISKCRSYHRIIESSASSSANFHLHYLNVLEGSSSRMRTSLRAGWKSSIIAAQAEPASNRAGKQVLGMYVPDSNHPCGRVPASKTPHFLLSRITRLPRSNGVLLRTGLRLSLCSAAPATAASCHIAMLWATVQCRIVPLGIWHENPVFLLE